MTSSNGNIFRATGHLCGEFTGQRWIPHTKASNAELCFFSLLRAWINGWVNNHKAGDLRCRRAHCDVTVMYINRHSLHYNLYTFHSTAVCLLTMVYTPTLIRWHLSKLSMWSCEVPRLFECKLARINGKLSKISPGSYLELFGSMTLRQSCYYVIWLMTPYLLNKSHSVQGLLLLREIKFDPGMDI